MIPLGELVSVEPYSAFPERKIKAMCHVDRPHHAKGFCYSCYRSDLRKRNPNIAEANKRRNIKMHQLHPSKRFFYHIKTRYGISEIDYNNLLKTQEYKCVVCEIPFEGKMKGPFVDHNHKTGKVRGLLCPCCNTFIGRIKDNPERAIYLAEYLK